MKENYVIQPFSNELPSDITLQQMNEYNVFNNGNGNGPGGNNGHGPGGNNGNGHGPGGNSGNGHGPGGNNGNGHGHGPGGNSGNGHGHGVDGNQGNGNGNNPVPVGGESILFVFILSYLIFKLFKK